MSEELEPAGSRLIPADAPDDYWADDLEELPSRPRRRLVTPVTGSLLAVLVAALGFVAGVLVEKGQSNGSTPTLAAGRRAAAFGAAGGPSGAARAFAGAAGGRASNATVGQISTMQGNTLYVSTLQGNTIEVKVPAGEKVSKTDSVGVKSIHPGDTVIVQGSHGSDGSVTATSVRDSGSSSAGGGFGALFGGGGAGGGAAGGGGLGGAGAGGGGFAGGGSGGGGSGRTGGGEGGGAGALFGP